MMMVTAPSRTAKVLTVVATLVWCAHSFVHPRVGVVHPHIGVDVERNDIIGAFDTPLIDTRRLSLVSRTAQKDPQSTMEETEPVDGKEIIGYEYRINLKQVLVLLTLQSGWILAAAAVAKGLHTPNFGLGPGFVWDTSSVFTGILYTVPLGIFAVVLDVFEDKIPALQEVAKATQHSILSLLGGVFRPGPALLAATALGVVAGLGEEMAFRGVLQYELANSFMNDVGSIATTAIMFGALHAITPLYAFFAALASVYFGWLYIATGNLAVPIVAHGLYDIGALFFAHWTVCGLSMEKQEEIANWLPPMMRNEEAS